MSTTAKNLIILLILVAGMVLWVGYSQRFSKENKLSYEPNVACLKGSPYGKILALAMQGSIDFYWHKGSSHEHAEVLADGDHHHDHDHYHHDHHHDHDHDFYTLTEDHGEKSNRTLKPSEHVGKHLDVKKREPLRVRATKIIRKMAATAHRRTDDKQLTTAHKKYLQGVTEDKLELAYKLDPSNYTNYGNYHLFIVTTNYGRSAANDDAALKLAHETLVYCKSDQLDPASYVTAASAAYNVIYHIGRHHERYSIADAKTSLAEFDHCIKRHKEILALAVEEGRITSEIRYREMAERIRYLTKLREAQGKYMKRVMATKMTSNKIKTTK